MLESAHEDFKNSCYKYATDLKKTRTQQSKREETRKKQMEILDLKMRTHELEIQQTGLTIPWTLQKETQTNHSEFKERYNWDTEGNEKMEKDKTKNQ